VYLPFFYTWTGAILGRFTEETLEKARLEYGVTLLTTWGIFAPVNILNFGLVPLRHQVAVNTATGFVYNVALSLIAGSGRGAERREAPYAEPPVCAAVAPAREAVPEQD